MREGYVAVVTGGSRGIGEAIVDRFVKDERCSKVFTCGRSEGHFEPQSKVHYSRVNLVDSEEVVRWFRSELPKTFDVLINNAGQWPVKQSQVPEMFEVNYHAPELLMRLLVEQITCTRELWRVPVRVVNICSTVATRPDGGSPEYGAAKAALLSLTKSYAIRYPELLRTVSISPGFVRTELVSKEPLPTELLDRIPLKREALSAEVAELVWRVIDLDYLTGADIVFDGGSSV